MLRPAHCRGFTLIELLIAVTISGVLVALGAPALGTYLQNSRVGNAAAIYLAGVQAARTAAIQRNAPVSFVLTSTPGTGDALANGAVPNTAGVNWVVRAASGAGFEAVDSKAGAEGEGSVQLTANGPAGFAGVITFNGFGATSDNQPYSIAVTNPGAGACANTGGPIRCRLITIAPAGKITACDPAAAQGDSRAC
ncbi:MAG: prepilin-type N-terminal cleavage/methylation domain-containing protein [Pseudomonadota bacterium]|nr:prepilin-type N-terminal cleavage/methylation domain-containing protein [Pseudomonadota bacterium]